MDTFDNLINLNIEEYCIEYSDIEEEVLYELYRQTNLKFVSPRMASGRMQSLFLQLLIKLKKPKIALEIGTFTGYAAISIAFALPENSKLITIEANNEYEEFITKYINKSKTQNKISLLIGDAIEIIPTIDSLFDFVFIDANKNDYIKYYELIFDKVNSGGLIVADNVLWGGKVIKGSGGENNKDTKAVIEFNNYIKNDSRVEKLLLPIRDGLYVIRKK